MFQQQQVNVARGNAFNMGRQKKTCSKHRSRSKRKPLDSTSSENDTLENLPYKVQESEVLGRYLVAAKNLLPGEVVVSDEPLVVGPCQEAKPLCIGCYSDLDLRNSQSYHRWVTHFLWLMWDLCVKKNMAECVKCSWPLCASTCPGYRQPHGHSEEECRLLSKSSIPTKEISDFENFYYALTPLRCLMKKTENSEKWKMLSAMESHTEQRKQSTVLWETNERLAVNVIRNVFGLTEFSEEEIHFVCGVLEVNAFEINIKPGMQCLRGVYPRAFLFAHACVPNTCRSNGSDFRLSVRAMTAIPANEMITISYAYTLQCTLLRRKHLKETKFFSCSCKRCSDPTELGTFAGAIKCFTCKVGFLLPEDPLDKNSSWKCTSGTCTSKVSQIIPMLDKLFKELDSIDGNDIVGYETYLQKCSTIFHDNHYLCLSAMHCLSQLYGKVDGYLINDLTEEQLERKEEICRKLLKIFEKLEPGLSKQRGILLYELQAPIMVLLRRKFQNIPKKALKSKIKVVLKYLEESFLILSKEPENSVEGQMAAAASEAITSLRGWLNILG